MLEYIMEMCILSGILFWTIFVQDMSVLDLGIFQSYTHASVRCPQLLLNDLQDFYETLWSVRIYNGDVHIVRNFVLDNFCTKYERLDLGIFHQSHGQFLHQLKYSSTQRYPVRGV